MSTTGDGRGARPKAGSLSGPREDGSRIPGCKWPLHMESAPRFPRSPFSRGVNHLQSPDQGCWKPPGSVARGSRQPQGRLRAWQFCRVHALGRGRIGGGEEADGGRMAPSGLPFHGASWLAIRRDLSLFRTFTPCRREHRPCGRRVVWFPASILGFPSVAYMCTPGAPAPGLRRPGYTAMVLSRRASNRVPARAAAGFPAVQPAPGPTRQNWPLARMSPVLAGCRARAVELCVWRRRVAGRQPR